MTNAYRIVLADDHELFRSRVREILHGMEDIEVVAEAGNGLDLLQILCLTTTHMVIVDISMPKLRGIEAIGRIKNIHPGVKVLVLTMHKDNAYVQSALDAGADGYVLKETVDKELFPAITMVRLGQTCFPTFT